MPSVALEPAAISLLLRLTQARIGDTLHDGNGTVVTVVNAFTTVNPATEGIVRAVDYQVVGAPGQFRLFADDAGDVAALEAGRERGIVTAAAGEALRDLWEADDHVTSDQFRTGLADALMKFCRGLFATTNLIYLSRQIPLLRERLIVLLSGGEALVAASAARPEVAG